MSDEAQVMGRRGVLRGGTLAASVAAGAVIAAAVPQRASATTGDPVTVGGEFTASNDDTTFIVTNSTSTPALRLTNLTGPALTLTPTSAASLPTTLALGSIVNTASGPGIGVTDGAGGSVPTILATGNDLAALPLPQAITPVRLLDTRTATGRGNIVARSTGALDSANRLKGGAWIDIAVGDATGDSTLEAVFVNVTVTGPQANGFLSLCPSPQSKPAVSTINFVKGQTIANGAFVGAGVSGNAFAVRIYASVTTHVLLDLTGGSVSGVPGPQAAAATARARRAAVRMRPAARLSRLRSRKVG